MGNTVTLCSKEGVKYKVICNLTSKSISNPYKHIKINYRAQYQTLVLEDAELNEIKLI